MLEKLIANHCAPALAGIKPANIAACLKDCIPDVHERLEKLNGELNCRDIYLEIICECDKRALIVVYRRKILEKQLSLDENREFLLNFGYPESGSVEGYIRFLKTRLCREEFPHEIGVFLGYPLQDITAFINHRDEGCLLIGEWKVYHNPEEARKLFGRFKACRNALLRRVSGGRTLAQIFCAA